MLRTPCYDWHVAHNGRMVNFAGWEMPVQYTSVTDEHTAVRTAAGMFDIAHMGRLQFRGPDACGLLDHLVTNDVKKLGVGRIRYSLVTNEEGGILDDVLVYRFDDWYMLVVNASNRKKILGWIESHRDGFNVDVVDLTLERFMLALQGPRAIEILNPLCEFDVETMKYYTGVETTVDGRPAILSRTGYTGEDGCEVIVDAAEAADLWERLIGAGREHGLQAAGLGARDTLRLEAAMPLYGHELDETIDPFTAGLGFAIKLEAGEFIGREALKEARDRSGRPERVGLVLEGRRIAREDASVTSGEKQVGRVTSGTFSPTLEQSIAMAYVDPEQAEVGTALEVDIRGKRVAARVCELPFYSRG